MAKRVRALVATIVAGPFLSVIVGSSIDYPSSSLSWILVIGWLLMIGPFLIYLYGVVTATGSVLVGALLLSSIPLALGDMADAMARGSSTAGLALLWIPLLGYPVAILGTVVDRMVDYRRRIGHAEEPPPEPPTRANWRKELWVTSAITVSILGALSLWRDAATALGLVIPSFFLYAIFYGSLRFPDALRRAGRRLGSRLKPNRWRVVLTPTDLLIVKRPAQDDNRPDSSEITAR